MARSRRHRYGSHTYYSLYDLVAGRHRIEAPDPTRTSRSRLSERPLAPDEYLLKRWGKLQIYPFEEHADLPDTQLVMAIHWYISRRAAALGPQALETMDASALLAIAVEVEEKIKAALGSHGHLVYAQRKKPQGAEDRGYTSETEAEEVEDANEEMGREPSLNRKGITSVPSDFEGSDHLSDPLEALAESDSDSA